jgi:hypothetical protein
MSGRRRGSMSENPASPEPDDGRYSDAEAARLLAGLVGRRAELEWSVDLVKKRLEEAAKGCERVVGRVGPKGVGAGAWVNYELWGAPDVYDQNAAWEGAREGTRGPDRRALGRGGLSAIEYSRIVEASRWPLRYLSDPTHEKIRLALKCWLWCCARDKSFSAQRAELGCSRQEAYRRIDRAAAVILEGVKRDKLPPDFPWWLKR